MSDETTADQPVLQVLTPNTTAEEVAAIVAVLAASSAAVVEPPRPHSEWSSHHRKLTPVFPHGRGGWRASGLPR